MKEMEIRDLLKLKREQREGEGEKKAWYERPASRTGSVRSAVFADGAAGHAQWRPDERQIRPFWVWQGHEFFLLLRKTVVFFAVQMC